MNNILLLLFLLIILGCSEKKSSTANNDKLAKIKFTSNTINIGEFKSGSKKEIVFYAINKSDNPLLIDTLQASCACTVAYFTKKPILKNDSGLITIEFNPKIGVYGFFEKNVVVSANTKPAFTVLTIKGEIIQ